MNAVIAGKFVEDWDSASEDLMSEAEQGITDVEYIELINKIYNAPRKKHGKFGFNIEVELTDKESELLKGEAKYRMQFWSLIYQDCKSDIDKPAHNAAKKLFIALGGVVTESMANEMGVR